MSLYRLEQVVYDLGVKGDARKRFAKNPERFLNSYFLDDEERRLIQEFDVRQLVDKGISPL